MAGNRAKRSAVWSHFMRKADGGICNHCQLFCQGKGGNTSNLIKHLRIKHKIDINPCTIFNVKKPKVDLDSDPQVESGDSDVSDKKGTCTFF